MKIVVWLFVVSMGFCIRGVCAQEVQGAGPRIYRATAVVLGHGTRKDMLIGASGGIYKSDNGGLSWNIALSLLGRPEIRNFYREASGSVVYAATAAGVYRSDDSGSSWQKVFKGGGAGEQDGKTIARIGDCLYYGSRAGLFESRDKKARTWRRVSGVLGHAEIVGLAESGYVASGDALYRLDAVNQEWVKVFSISAALETAETGADEEESELYESDDVPQISSVVPGSNIREVLVATRNCVYRSTDEGSTWQPLSVVGLRGRIIALAFDRADHPYCVTDRVLYEYKDERWQLVSQVPFFSQPRALAIDGSGVIYLACKEGIVSFGPQAAGREYALTQKTVEKQAEIGIYEVQQAAIRYAEVSPQKIEQWRKRAAVKAWLPQVNAGFSRDTGELWHWEGGSTSKADDDSLRRGRDVLDWSLTLSWDLADLVFSQDQTSIDTRSRLTVQLRNDIVDQVTKLYFERLRLIRDIDNLSIEDRRKRSEKELKLNEITALLDGYTGGIFSSSGR